MFYKFVLFENLEFIKILQLFKLTECITKFIKMIDKSYLIQLYYFLSSLLYTQKNFDMKATNALKISFCQMKKALTQKILTTLNPKHFEI